MTCRFCTQWNPQTAVKCAFCGNSLDASEDLTAAARKRQIDIRLPRVLARRISLRGGNRPRGGVTEEPNVVGMGLVGLGALVILLSLLSKMC